jgi:hypothetical protein
MPAASGELNLPGAKPITRTSRYLAQLLVDTAVLSIARLTLVGGNCTVDPQPKSGEAKAGCGGTNFPDLPTQTGMGRTAQSNLRPVTFKTQPVS